MNEIDALERLAKLRADGLLTDEEFAMRKAAILKSPQEPNPNHSLPDSPVVTAPRRNGLWVVGGLALVAVAGFGFSIYSYESGARTPTIENTVAPADQFLTNSSFSPSNATSAIASRPTATDVQPPADFLDLCVAADRVPMGFRVKRLVANLIAARRSVIWSPSGNDWILRQRWRDDLGQANHEVSFLFSPEPGIQPSPGCSQTKVEVVLHRMVADGVEVTGQAQGKLLDSVAGNLYMKDYAPPAPKADTGKPEATGEARTAGECDNLPANVTCDYGGD
ncbi:MAG: SHOCT domain-containing protein [Sphingobium sp.]